MNLRIFLLLLLCSVAVTACKDHRDLPQHSGPPVGNSTISPTNPEPMAPTPNVATPAPADTRK
jgi:hypothetical protein